MSESEQSPSDVIDLAVAASTAPTSSGPASPSASPAAHALLELIGRALAPEADETTRAQARELWTQCATALLAGTTAASPPPPQPAGLPMPVAPFPLPPPSMPLPPPSMPTPPLMAAMQAIKQMTPDQLLDTALQRLRAALPSGANVPASRGIQFHLVPVPPTTPGVR